MGTFTDKNKAVADEIIEVEQELRRLVNEDDWTGFAELLEDEATFTHQSTRVEGKASWIAGWQNPRRNQYREGLKIMSHEDLAITTGDVTHVFVDEDNQPTGVMLTSVVQVWRRRDGRWRLAAYQHWHSPAQR